MQQKFYQNRIFKVSLIILFLFFISCSENKIKQELQTETELQTQNETDYHIIIIDSCEYIILHRKLYTLTHKGNCKNCKENAK